MAWIYCGCRPLVGTRPEWARLRAGPSFWANLDYNNYGEPRFVAASLRWKF
ncbi:MULTISPECIES: hypothetical protein [Stenotrophomonas]|uniref:hypothetical protein n=1 Tax=Stenotrophomonas TaxID=40323 RepID=UPI00131F2CAB|nr:MULTISPECIES: hypothetical protein [Stenotrophomonas]